MENLMMQKKIFLKVIELSPNYSKAYLGLGKSLKNLGNIEQAKESYKKAIQLESNNNLKVTLRNNKDKL